MAEGRTYRVPGAETLTALAGEFRDGASYQTILSFVRTPGLLALKHYVAALKLILAPDGWILMVEPTRPDGAPVLGSRLFASGGGPDLVTALRAAGLFVTDVERRSCRSLPRRWRDYVVLRARHETPPARDRPVG